MPVLNGIRRAIAIVFVTVAIAALGTASAAGLGPMRAKHLTVVNATVQIAPANTITCDNFSQASNTGRDLDGRLTVPAATCGGYEWLVHRGDWLITNGRLAGQGSRAVATIGAGQSSISAQATVYSGNGGNRLAGVVIDYSMTTRNFLVGAVSGPGSVQLLLVLNNNNPTTLASGTATIGTSDTLRITRNGTKVTVSVNGAVKVTYTLTAAQVTSLNGGTRTGLYWNAGTGIEFTNFLATQPVAP